MASPRRPTLRYSGPLTVVEVTGPWGVYAGERIVLGDGRSFEDDLGIKLRRAFQAGAADALERGDSLPEAFELADVEIQVRVRRRHRGSPRT